jgi:hypothetical protein
MFFLTPAAASGYPHITVPCGKVYELPFFGTAYSDELIGLAYAFEQASNNRIKPSFKKSFIETPSNRPVTTNKMNARCYGICKCVFFFEILIVNFLYQLIVFIFH